MARLRAALERAGARLKEASAPFGQPIALEMDTFLSRDAPSGLKVPGLVSANGQCRMIRTADGWLAVNLSREDDREAVPAWLECAIDGELWSAIQAEAMTRGTDDLLERAILLHLPVAGWGEAEPIALPLAPVAQACLDPSQHRVLDLSALWAGPACGGLLAELGMAVTKVESATRPDPTPISSPRLDARLNGLKQRVVAEPDSQVVRDALAQASILITSGRPHALARMGLEPGVVFALNPSLVWVAITAHGWTGEAGLRVGFGDDCAVAGGLVRQQAGAPHFMGDALADPLTGLLAATRAMEMVAAGESGLLDMPLARCAAWFAQAARLR
jgi:hypothetical protein